MVTESLESDPGGSTHPIVLILSTAFPPDPWSGAARAGRIAKYLPHFGYEPIVICQRLNGCEEESAGVYRVPLPAAGLKTRLRARVGERLQRYLLPYNDQIPWASHALAQAESVLTERAVSSIISTSPPVAAHLAASKLQRRYGLPWIADFRDPLYGNPFRSRRWFFPYDAMLERYLFKRADALIANTDTVADLWRRRYPAATNKIKVICNGFDPEDWIDAPPPPWKERRVLAHVGSLYGKRRPLKLLSSLERLVRNGALSADRFVVRLIGPLDRECAWLREESVGALQGWGSLEFDGKLIPRSEARRAAADADCLLLLDANDEGADFQVPAKLFEYIQIGRPILAFTPLHSPTAQILMGSGVTHKIVPCDADDAEVDSVIRSFFDLPESLVRPCEWFDHTFNGRNQVKTLARILDALRGETPLPTTADVRLTTS